MRKDNRSGWTTYLCALFILSMFFNGTGSWVLGDGASKKYNEFAANSISFFGFGLLSPDEVSAQTPGDTVFGPQSYVGSKGKPSSMPETFSISAPGEGYTLHIDNGAGSRSCKKRVSSALVLLNGRVVVEPEAFDQEVVVIERRVTLLEENTLTVQVRGPKQGCFTLSLQVLTNLSPIADAGLDQTVPVGELVQLDGRGSSDPNGDALTFSWTFNSVPSGSMTTIIDSSTALPRFIADVSGIYIVDLVVNDGLLESVLDRVTITTTNSRPVANAGADQTVRVADLVQLDGSGSSDIDGDPLSFSWSLLLTPSNSLAVLSDATAVQPTFTVDQPGTYVLELIVDDGQVTSQADLVSIVTENSQPIADAGPDQTIAVTETVTLDGSGSFDVDGDPLTFEWVFLEIPPGSTAMLSDSTAVLPTFAADQPGSYVAQLIVHDGIGPSGPDSVVVITVNSPPVSNAGSDQSVAVTDLVQLDGSGSTDVDSDLLTFAWALISKPIGSAATLSDPNAVQPTFTVDRSGVYIVQLIVNDGTVDSLPDTVTIDTVNSLPVAEAGPDQTVVVTQPVLLDGTGSFDVDGDPLTFTWALLSRPAESTAVLSDLNAVQPTFTVDQTGIYVAQLIVNDGRVDSAPDTVTFSTENSRPVAEAGADQEVALESTVQLDGNASSDADNDSLTFQWALISVPNGSTTNLSDPSAVAPSFVADQAGTYVVQLIVNDGRVDSAPDTVTITTENTPPVANAGLDQTVSKGTTINLDGTASSDADGNPLTYNWTILSTPAGSSTTLNGATTASPSVTPDLIGDYELQLIVNDGQVDSMPDTIRVTATNTAPIADAGAGQTVSIGMAVNFDGSGSTDANGDLLTFSWTLTGVPPGSTSTLVNPASVNPSLIPDKFGTYTVQLIVNDGLVDSVPAFVTVITSNDPPVLNPIGDQTVLLGQTLNLTLIGTDPNGQPLSFSASPLPLPNNSHLEGTTGTFSFTPDSTQVGNVEVRFLVSDGNLIDEEVVTITVQGPQPGSTTSLTGRLLDTTSYTLGAEVPVVGAVVSLLGTGAASTTDGAGTFALTNIPADIQVLDIATATASPAPDGAAYAGFREKITILDGIVNVVDRPFFMPRIDPASVTTIDPNATTIVTNPNLGVTLTIPPNTAKNPDDTNFTGELSISLVPDTLAPAALPEELQPGLLITIQPVGVTFATPVPISFPNSGEGGSGDEVGIWSLDPSTGTFETVGTGQISPDGTQIHTISGGVQAADWHFPLPPAPPGGPAPEGPGPGMGGGGPPPPCQIPFGSEVTLVNGCVETDITLPAYVSLSEARNVRLVYKSNRAFPQVVLPFDGTILREAAIPPLMSYRVNVGGVDVTSEIFVDTGGNDSGLDPNADNPIRMAAAVDAQSLPTGIYPYTVKLTSWYCVRDVCGPGIGNILAGNEGLSVSEGSPDVQGLRLVENEAYVLPVPSLRHSDWGTSQGKSPHNPYLHRMTFKGLPSPVVNSVTPEVPSWVHPTQGVLPGPRNTWVSSKFNGILPVINGQASPIGAGWGLDGLQRLHVRPNGNALITNGDGSYQIFTRLASIQEGTAPQKISSTQGGFGSGLDDVDKIGRAVVNLGDLDGDGIEDLAVGTQLDDDGGSGTGAVWILFLNADRTVKSKQKLSDTSPGGLNGALSAGDNFGVSLANIGDLDGDGVIDLVVGNNNDDDTIGTGGSHGAVWVLFLNSDGTVKDKQKISNLQGGFFQAAGAIGIGGLSIGDRFGQGVASLGDLDGDGVTDIAVGAPGTEQGFNAANDGALWILFLNADGTVKRVELINEEHGNFTGTIVADASFGTSVANLGDLDQDGVIDVAVGALGDDDGGTDRGAVYLLFLNANGTVKAHQKISSTQGQFDQLANGSLLDNSDFFGVSVARVPDVNGDGIPELAVGAHQDDDGATNSGALWMLFLRPNGLVDSSIKISNTQGPFSGALQAGDRFGVSVTSLGDVNNDSLPEIAVGAFQDDDGGMDRGAVWIISLDNRAFASPPGDYSALIQNSDDTFTRVLKHGTRIEFDEQGLQTAIVDRNGNTTAFSYNGSHQLETITDPVGLITTFAYSGGHLSSVTDPANRVTTFEHDGDDNLTKVTFPDATSRSYGYDANHLMTSETNARGFTTLREYDATGRAKKATLPDGSVRKTTNGQSIGLAGLASGVGAPDNPAPVQKTEDVKSTITDGENRTNVVQTGEFGEPKLTTDAANLSTKIDRDVNGNPTRIELPSGHILNQTFDQKGNLLTFKDEIANGTTTLIYDTTFNQVTSITDPQNKTTSLTYDSKGNLTKITTPLGRQASIDEYEQHGLPKSYTDYQGTSGTLVYDSRGNLITHMVGTGVEQRVTTYTYTSEGYLETMTDPLNRTVTFTYDLWGQILTKTLPDNRVVTFAYDANGNNTSLTPPGRPPHVFRHNALDLEAEYDPPDLLGVPIDKTQLMYNHAQQLTNLLRADGNVLNVGYDNAGRNNILTFPRGQVINGYSDTSGQLESISAPQGIETMYEYTGELPKKESWAGPITGSVGHTFDSSNRMDSESVNGGNTVAMVYDNDSHVIQVGDLAVTRHPQSGFIKDTTLGVVTDSRTYNGFGELETYSAEVNGIAIFSTQYTRDKLGRITEKVETIEGVTQTFTYSYDLAGRLMEVRKDGNTISSYTYDANGNRLSHTTLGGTVGATYDEQDRLLVYGDTTYAYTADGELEQKNNTTTNEMTPYVYDELGNLLQVTILGTNRINYLIDGQNRRVGKKMNDVLVQGLLYRDGLNPVAELDGEGNLVSQFVYGTKRNVPDFIMKDGATYRIISDHLGSPRLVINSTTGDVVQQMEYNEFGKVLFDTNLGFQPFGFAGGIYDPQTKLVRLGMRDFDVETGRWTTKDPLLFAGGQSNLYQYSFGDPVNFLDLTGLKPNKTRKVVEAGIGLGIELRNQALVRLGLLGEGVSVTRLTLASSLMSAGVGAVFAIKSGLEGDFEGVVKNGGGIVMSGLALGIGGSLGAGVAVAYSGALLANELGLSDYIVNEADHIFMGIDFIANEILPTPRRFKNSHRHHPGVCRGRAPVGEVEIGPFRINGVLYHSEYMTLEYMLGY